MARHRNSTGTTEAPTEATDPQTTQEDTVTVTAPEVTDEAAAPVEADSTTVQSDAPEAPAEAAPVKAEIDLTAFQAAVTAALESDGRDATTGDLAEAVIAPVVTEYRNLNGIAAKNKGKAVLIDGMRDAINALDTPLARSYLVLQKHLSAAPSGSGERQPADPTEAYVQRKVGLSLALALCDKPEGVADDAEDRVTKAYGDVFPQAQSYMAWSVSTDENKGDEPEAPAYVKGAVKLALGKSAKVGGGTRAGGGASSGERHDIGEHIRQAFEEKDSGAFLTIAEIRNSKSTEYGDNPPSAGAISARLFPQSGKCTLDFVTPGTNADGNRGATKN